MAFDETLAETVRRQLGGESGVSEKRMFGGLAFLFNGNMGLGILGSDLIVRVGAEAAQAALRKPGVQSFAPTGRPMKGWLLVGSAGTKQPASLASWIRRGADYACSLPAK
jgi:TfoX/Sxy family transcriptional regulator of competence genes